MRLPEVERGDTLRHRALITGISRMTGLRLPDAARVAFYRNDFAGPALGAWTQRTMRGASGWSVSERELMAASVATWNSCPFCIGAHTAVAIRGMEKDIVDAVLTDYRTAQIPEKLKAALQFIEKVTKTPDELGTADARRAMQAGVTRAELEDAAAVAALFAIITRYANALDFDIPNATDFKKAAGMLLRRGYA
ncbi:hypothetical protein HII28_19630 [Planctomonas sp. JC2975]|uniref:carboxymuconolactone decarboxylase family protein n=1 Tax=Planctomonas sp. JC2975 TaxID=2729626 RepID=UPI001474E2D6|nr:carboxymuconolactone decarboxylase family protein [Planctomonas sp. JC2975]NNC14075.1 hypothetical protein [Planctomonas sp. JC2975]